MRILIIGGISRSLVNFRGPLIRAMLAEGHEVITCAGEPEPDVADTLRDWGVRFTPLRLSRAGMSPLGDIRTCLQLHHLIREYRPGAVLAYTIKPVIWGGIAARLAGVPRIYSLITGLGYAFMGSETEDGRRKTEDNEGETADCRLQTADLKEETEDRATGGSRTLRELRALRGSLPPIKQRLAGFIAKRLYKFALHFSIKVFFQNPDDCREFIDTRLVDQRKTVVVSGSGVDLEKFQTADCRPQTADCRPQTADHQEKTEDDPNQEQRTKNKEPVSFLLIARLLADKGIREYAHAARLLKATESSLLPSPRRATAWSPPSSSLPNQEPRTKNQEPIFLLAGDLDPNPASISQAELDAWIAEGTLDHLGYLDDVRPAYEQCSVYVLPSYREGTPRTVLEAMAMGRPIITTDAPGCSETVRSKAESRKSKVEIGGETADHRPQTADLLPSPRRSTAWSPSPSPQPATLQPATKNQEPRTKNLIFGTNGILIPPRDAGALAEAMRFFIDNPEQIAIMGRESRKYAEDRYDVHKVNAVMLREIGMGGEDFISRRAQV